MNKWINSDIMYIGSIIRFFLFLYNFQLFFFYSIEKNAAIYKIKSTEDLIQI
jgi:hypothetical protein